MSLRTCCRNVSLICVLLALVILAAPAFAGNTCLQDEYNNVAKQKLNCTANDVRVAEAVNIRDLNGAPLTTCIQGQTFDFIADFEIVTSSTSSRSNIGLYFATDNVTSALASGGSCVDNIIPPVNHACVGAPNVTCGSDVHDEFDAQPDNCGDTSSQDNGAFGPGSQKVTIVVPNFLCQAPAGQTGTPHLVLPNCTSWQIPGGTIQCNSTGPNYPWVQAAIPGTPSKCNCGIINLPIQPVTPSALTAKACNTHFASPTPNTTTPTYDFTGNTGVGSPASCDAGVEGSKATYFVAIKNTTSFGAIHIDQICDNVYGTIYDDNLLNAQNTRVFPVCSAGATLLHGALNVDCPPADIAKDATGTCSFTAPVGENANVTDTVTSAGHSSVSTGQTFSGSTSNSVTVTSTDAPSTAKIVKGVDSTTAACATVRYSVDAANTSGFDENLTLNTLNDSAYGDVTKCTNLNCANSSGANGSLQILGTTCGQPVAGGLGTLSASPGAGALPASLPVGGAHYQCKFDAQFCSALANGCISNTDKVNGTYTADEAADSVTETANTITVQECLAITVTSTP
jgi:hypothetical protein